MSYPKNQVVKFDTPKLGLGLFKKNYLGRFLELKERAGSSMSTVSRLCSAPPLQPLLRSIVTSIKHQASQLLLRHRPRLSILSHLARLRSQVPLPQLLCLRSFCLSMDVDDDWYDGLSSLRKMLELPGRRDRVSRESAGNLWVLVCCVQSERTSDHFIEVA